MATNCKYEFQVKNFGFVDCKASCFYEMQWTKNRLVFVIYRAFICLYHWAWLIASWVEAAPNIYYTLSNWSFFFTGVYFLLAFVLSIYGNFCQKSSTNAVGNENVESQNGNVHQDRLRWYHIPTWLFQVISFGHAMWVLLIFWGILAKDKSPEYLKEPIGQHKHSVQLGLLLIDIFMTSFPVRWLHFVYLTLFAFLYSIFTAIIHVTNVNSRIYGFLDYKNNPGLGVGVLLVAAIVAAPVLHTITFALYHLRAAIYRCTVERTEDKTRVKFDAGHQNIGFTEG